MEKEPQIEQFEVAQLEIDVPSDDKHARLSFECGNWGTCYAYNLAVEEITKREGFEPSHQAGQEGETPHEPGHHMWEFWGKADPKRLENFILEIQELAEERFKDQEEAGMKEHFEKKKSPK